MTRTKLKSSNIISVGYSRERQVLEVEFPGGNVYEYYKVPEEFFHELCNHTNPGKYLSLNIKGNFEYMKLPREIEVEQTDGRD